MYLQGISMNQKSDTKLRCQDFHYCVRSKVNQLLSKFSALVLIGSIELVNVNHSLYNFQFFYLISLFILWEFCILPPILLTSWVPHRKHFSHWNLRSLEDRIHSIGNMSITKGWILYRVEQLNDNCHKQYSMRKEVIEVCMDRPF